MGLENRDYVRDGSYTERVAGWGLEFTPVVKALILVNVAVFLLQIFVTRRAPLEGPFQDEEIEAAIERQKAEFERMRAEAKKGDGAKQDKQPEIDWEKQKEAMRQAKRVMEQMVNHLPGTRISVVQEWCELDPKKTVYQGQVWRLITCAFCHDRLTPWHILLNMVLLYWFGTRLENMYGPREFLLFYLAAAISGSLAYVGLALYTESNVPAIGASGAVMGVMMLYAIYYPFETVTLFWLLPVPIWVLLSLYVLFDLHPVLLALAGDKLFSGIAHAGHLGGLAFGFVYYKTGVRLSAPFEREPRPAPERRPRAEAPRRAEPPREALAEQVDEILKKISEQGKDSLTEKERAILHQASARYRAEK
jgi:membrane associated rhomboid family serine protease